MTYNVMTNISGMNDIIKYIATEVPSFTWIFLLTLALIVTVVSYLSAKRNGQGDFFASLTVGFVFSEIVAIMLTLADGIISSWLVGIWTILTGAVWIGFVVIKKRTE